MFAAGGHLGAALAMVAILAHALGVVLFVYVLTIPDFVVTHAVPSLYHACFFFLGGGNLV